MISKFSYFLMVLSCFAMLAVSGQAEAQQKVAVVSLQQALNQTEEGKKSMAAIQADMQLKKKQLDDMKTELKSMRDEIEKQKMVLSKEALDAKAGAIQTKFLELQRKAVEYEQALRQKETDSVGKILKSLRTVVIELAKREKYDIVYENSADVILYSANAVDITAEVIKAYNRGK